MNQLQGKPNYFPSITLYYFVFSSRLVKFSVSLLLIGFLVQPIALAYANEEGPASKPTSADSSEKLPASKPEAEPKPMVETADAEDSSNQSESETASPAVEESITLETDLSTTNSQIPKTEDSEANVEQQSNEEDTDFDSPEPIDDDTASKSSTTTEDSQTSQNQMTNPALLTNSTANAESANQTITATTSQFSVDSTESGLGSIDQSNGIDTAATTTLSQPESEVDNSDQVGSFDDDERADQTNELVVIDQEIDQKDELTNLEADSADADGPDNYLNQATSTATTTDEMVIQSTATSSEAEQIATSTVVEVSTVINDSNRHQFSVDECTSVGDGSFYCSQTDTAPELLKDGVFTVPGSDGDMEIVVRMAGEEQYLTDNTVDDGAPYFDPVSQRVVWHSLVNDRYQVVSYDFASQETTYLTKESFNNMEPSANGQYTLWQAWIDNNWEIMLHDGKTTKQLTVNSMHDIAPQIRGGYVMWQTQFQDGWQVAMYDLESEIVTYLGEGDGARVQNPRFVLVYDSFDANGDIRTVGYDLKNQETIPLSQLPTPLPERLPEPESTGEVRALIQNKSPKEDHELVDLTPSASGQSSSQTTATTSSTTKSSLAGLELDLSTITKPAPEKIATTSNDVVIPSQNQDNNTATSAASANVQHIPEVVIPPLATSTDALSR